MLEAVASESRGKARPPAVRHHGEQVPMQGFFAACHVYSLVYHSPAVTAFGQRNAPDWERSTGGEDSGPLRAGCDL